MIAIHPRTLFALLLAATTPGVAQSSAGHRLGQRAALPDSVREVLGGGRFQVTIERQVTDSFQRQLIELAERILPDTVAINVAALKESLPRVKERLAAAERMVGERWWWDEADGILTPYALTGAAVRYFLERIHERAAGDNTLARDRWATHRGELTYAAAVDRIAPGDADGATFVVRMRLTWSYSCGMLCGMSFHATRAVFFDADGALIRIEGDGKPLVIMS
ncbi:MAG: hypothetical protein SFU57_02385 [Gemmatimonadales bacterium]|nr:hypothetical protein [Gemmatimonadales bacterium]